MVDIDRRNTNLTVAQAAAAAASGEWGVPEFQREFVWSPARVASLTRSLLSGWSMSCWHLWQPRRNREEVRHRTRRVELDAAERWILDGQQRLTSVALITGRRPAWYPAPAWTRLSATHAPALDLRALEAGRVVVGMPQVPTTWWLPFPAMFVGARQLQAELTGRGFPDCYGQVIEATGHIDGYQIPIVTLHHTPAAAVVEQFRLLNQQSTRVPAAIIRQGVLSVMVPGFTVDFAEPLRAELGLAGWPVRQTTIIDAFLAVAGVKRVEAVDPDNVAALQKRNEAAWRSTVTYLASIGIHGLSCWPAERMLRALVIVADTWPEAHSDSRLGDWVISALWDGHQALSDMLVQDIATIQLGRKAGASWDDVISDLCARLEPTPRAVKPGELTDIKTSPASAGNAGGRERMAYGAAHPNPPEITKNAKVPVWVPLNDAPAGIADWAVTLGTTRSAAPGVDVFNRTERNRQAIVTPHSSSTRSKALAATLNTALQEIGSRVRPSAKAR